MENTTENTTTTFVMPSVKEINEMKFKPLREVAKRANVYVGQHPTADSIRQKLIASISAESREGPGRPPKVPTKDILDAVEKSSNLKGVLDLLGLPEFNQFGTPNTRWLACRLCHLRKTYKVKEFPRGRPKAVLTEQAAA